MGRGYSTPQAPAPMDHDGSEMSDKICSSLSIPCGLDSTEHDENNVVDTSFRLGTSPDQNKNPCSSTAKLSDLSREAVPCMPFMKAHRNFHCKGKPYECMECGKCYSGKARLKIHTKSHTGQNPLHTCPICGKSLSSLGYLKRHSRSHSKRKKPEKKKREKTHICQECEKPFISAIDLRRHVRVHTGEKPHICEECGKMCSQKSNLIRHMKIHAEEKSEYTPYERTLTSLSQISDELVRNILYQRMISDSNNFLSKFFGSNPKKAQSSEIEPS